jgi:DNA-directed RNA polymerase specialized sigma24 family protein
MMKSDVLSHFTDKELVDTLQTATSEESRESLFVELYRRYVKKVEEWVKSAHKRGKLNGSYTDDVINAVFFEELYPEEVLLFSIGLNEQPIELDSPEGIKDLYQQFQENKIPLSQSLSVTKATHNQLLITDKEKEKTYTVRKEEEQLHIYEQRGLLAFRQNIPLQTYIRTVTRRCIDESSKGYYELLDAIFETWRGPGDLQDSSSGADGRVIPNQQREIMERMLDGLSQGPRKDAWKDAAIIRWYHWEHLTDRAIGEKLNMSEFAVTVRRHRAYQELLKIALDELEKSLDRLIATAGKWADDYAAATKRMERG